MSYLAVQELPAALECNARSEEQLLCAEDTRVSSAHNTAKFPEARQFVTVGRFAVQHPVPFSLSLRIGFTLDV